MKDFYKGKKVLITGNTGFKGTWLTKILVNFGANVIGYALKPNTIPSLFEQIELENKINQIYSDVRDLSKLKSVFDEFQPEIVFHLAAQPLVRESYDNPIETYEINVMGTANVLECVRKSKSVKSVVNVTTDKVYRNNEWDWGYRETDVLDGHDPYSNSKSCSELVTSSYIRSFLSEMKIPVSTLRAGNVLGGGDYSKDRIVPDTVKAMYDGNPLIIRNPNSIRPYQHVLEPLFAYMEVAYRQSLDNKMASNYNIGPNESDCVKTIQLIELFNKALKSRSKELVEYTVQINPNAVHEAHFLKLDISKFRNAFDWNPLWSIEKTLDKVVEFALVEQNKSELDKIMNKQIESYMGEQNVK